MNAVVEVLKRARDRVKKGWLQNAACNDAMTRVCAAEALCLSAQEESKSSVEVGALTTISGEILLAAATEQTQISWLSIPSWNDFETRTQDEVVDTFDHAIKLAERNLGGA